MDESLTGEAAVAYVSAWMESDRGRKPVNAAKLRADALAARTSRPALARLRLASLRLCARRPPAVPCARRGRPRASRARRTRHAHRSAAARGAPARPGVAA